MRRIEALEIKEPAKVNQINPPQIHNPGRSYCQAPNHIFKECTVFQIHQLPPEHMNAAYSRPQNNSYSQTYNFGWRNHPNFSWGPNNSPRPNFPNNIHHLNPQANFLNQASSSSFQNLSTEKKFSELEKSIELILKSQTAFM